MYVFLVMNIALLGLIVGIHYLHLKKNEAEVIDYGTVASSSENGLDCECYKNALLALKQSVADSETSSKGESYSHIWQTDIEMLQTLIDYYKHAAFSKRILFNANIAETLTNEQIRNYHVIHIVGNLLQNALEALEALPEASARRMGIWIACEADELCIRVHNSYPEALRHKADLQQWCSPGYSTKGSEDRGHGLPLLKKLVSEQDGIIYLDTEQGITFIVEFAG